MTPSVLIPGTLCDARVFDGLIPGLIDPVALDYSEHDSAAKAAADLLDDVPPASLGIAFSLGGWVLLEMLRLAPDRFVGGVLLSGNAFPDVPGLADGRRDRVAEGRRMGLRAQVERDWAGWVGDRAVGDEGLRDRVATMADDLGHAVHGRQAELNIARPDRRALAAAHAGDLVAIVGDQDRLCPRERYKDLQAAGVALHTLSGVGHWVPMEAPAAVLAIIRGRFPEATA